MWSSFVASADGESLVELRVLDTVDVSEAEQRQELRRLQLLAIVEHPGLRKIIDLVPDHAPPFVVVERLNLLTADDADGCGVQDCHRLLDALACAHRFGVVAGPFSDADVRMRAVHDWILDLTDARTQSDHESILPPERRSGHVGDSGDSAGDVYSLSAILSERAQSLPDSGVADRTKLLHLLARGMAVAPEARPTAGQLALELSALSTADVQLQIRLRKRDSQLAGTIIPESSAEDPYSPTLAESASSAMTAPIPEQLGRFRLHERLGAGAAGTVYRATDCSNDENVALKILNATVAQNPSMLRRFTREARLLAQVGSPFVARLLDANSDQGLHFLAIEFMGFSSRSSL